MSLKVCTDCGTAYAPAAVCPQCGGGVFRFNWEEEQMPRATSGGISNGPAEPGEELPEAPGPRAPKAELVEHAVTVAGVDPDEAAAMTKAELSETIAAAAPPPLPPV